MRRAIDFAAAASQHGSWLNLVEGFFSKLARSVLRHIRVASKQELKNRLIAAMDYFNPGERVLLAADRRSITARRGRQADDAKEYPHCRRISSQGRMEEANDRRGHD